MKKIYHDKGYTLVELLAVMVVLMTVGTIIAGILISSLRGTSKTNTLTNVRQNGYYALDQMTKMLHDARQLESPYPCIVPPQPTPIPTITAVTIVSFDGGSTTLSCDGTTISSNSASLLDPTSVSLTSCYFTCRQGSASDFPSISINFSLTEYRPTGAVLFNEKTASASAIPFQTSVSLRNLSR